MKYQLLRKDRETGIYTIVAKYASKEEALEGKSRVVDRESIYSKISYIIMEVWYG